VTLAGPAHADTYPAYLVNQLRQDPVYISSYSGSATPSQAPEIRRLVTRIPLKTYVVVDVAAGPDGQLQDSDLAAILHDQLGGSLFIFSRDADGEVSATGFGTSLPVSDAMTAAYLELAPQPDLTLVQLVSRAAGPFSEQAQAQLGQALDAYQAAGKVLDQASGVCDLAGVLVLTQFGRNAAEATQAARPVPKARPLCFFNPLHGAAGHEIRWRALGERETLDVHVCDDSSRAAAQHRLPDVLVDRAAGQEVPYYEVDPEHSVWAATGYGQFADDLVQRILTRAVHPAR
jgi:hypothetical protein